MVTLVAEDVDPDLTTGFETKHVDPRLVTGKEQSRRSKEYEKKTAEILNGLMRETIGNSKTVPDAAALILHGGPLSKAVGDGADADIRIRKAVDFIHDGTSNPYVAMVFAGLPLIMQVIRNHETDIEKVEASRQVKIPFTKRTLKLKFKFKLRNPFLRGMTSDPKQVVRQVLTDPEIRAALAQEGIDVAAYPV